MIDGGALTINVKRAKGALSVEIDAPPMVSLARMLAGKSIDDAARMAGMVYPQTAAAETAAVLAACGRPVPDALARSAIVEALHGHAVKMLAAWPAAVGICPSAVPAPGTADPDLLELAIFGANGAPERLGQFEHWLACTDSPAARVLEAVWHHWDTRWGRAVLPLWSIEQPLGCVDWVEALIDGAVTDTGLVARVADSDLMREIEARRGRGLIWRLASRVSDTAMLLDRLRREDYSGVARTLRPGVGAVMVSSGTLLVEAELDRNDVARYQRLSPADFSLHPGGLMEQILTHLPARSRAPLSVIASLAVEAVDPGMPTRLTVPEPFSA